METVLATNKKPKRITESGFSMLKSKRKKAVPVDFDIANLLKKS